MSNPLRRATKATAGKLANVLLYHDRGLSSAGDTASIHSTMKRATSPPSAKRVRWDDSVLPDLGKSDQTRSKTEQDSQHDPAPAAKPSCSASDAIRVYSGEQAREEHAFSGAPSYVLLMKHVMYISYYTEYIHRCLASLTCHQATILLSA